MAFRNVVVPGFYRSLNDFNAFLEPEKKKKEDRSSKRYYSVERVISRRTNKGNVSKSIVFIFILYIDLFSSKLFVNSLFCFQFSRLHISSNGKITVVTTVLGKMNHISLQILRGKKTKYYNFGHFEIFCIKFKKQKQETLSCFRSFERPVVSRGRLEEHKDILVYNVSVKLKSKSRLPHHFHFHHDVFRLMFCNKGSKSRDGEAIMLDKADFHHLHLPAVWDQHLDKNGDGVVIGFPIRMQIHLSWSYKMRAFQHGKLVTRPKMPLEKLSIQFVSIPFSCENL